MQSPTLSDRDSIIIPAGENSAFYKPTLVYEKPGFSAETISFDVLVSDSVNLTIKQLRLQGLQRLRDIVNMALQDP